MLSRTEILEDGETGAHWIGEKEGVEEVVLYFHGGFQTIHHALIMKNKSLT